MAVGLLGRKKCNEKVLKVSGCLVRDYSSEASEWFLRKESLSAPSRLINSREVG
jgi:hypothetical protein